MILLDVTLTVSTKERTDRWIAFIHELGFFVYGQTEEEVNDRVGYMLNDLADSFEHDHHFVTYLDRHAVKYVKLDDIDGYPEPEGYVVSTRRPGLLGE